MGGSLMRAIVAIAACGTIAGCGANGKQTSVRLARFSDTQVQFSYPAAWRAQYPGHGLSQSSNIIVTLSTVHLQSPCRRLSANSGECGINLMINHLPPGGVFVAWILEGMTVPTPGVSTTVGGRPARVSFDAPVQVCGWLKLTQAITAYLAEGVEMTACARDSKNFKDQVEAMLNSVEFNTPTP